MSIKNYLQSGFTFSKIEYELKLEYLLFNSGLSIVALMLFPLSSIRLYQGHYLQSFINFLFVFISIYAIVYIRKSKTHTKKIVFPLIIFFAILVASSFLLTNMHLVGASWFMILIMTAFYLIGPKVGIYLTLFSSLSIALLSQIREPNYTMLEYLYVIMPLFMASMFIYLYEQRILSAKKLLEEKNQFLLKEVELKTAEEVLLIQHNKELADVISKSNIELYIVDFESDKYLYANQGGINALGYSLEELKQITVYDTNPSLMLETVNKLKAISKSVPNVINITQHKRKDGTTYGVQSLIHSIEYQGKHSYAIYDVNLTDVHAAQSQLLKEKEELLKKAYYDNLTKLPNRTLFNDRLKQAIAKSNRSQKDFAILFIDLDKFKEVNDSFGHNVGDTVLCEVANRFQSVLRDEDTISRFGGDEFVCIIEQLNSCKSPSFLAQKLIDRIKEPIIIQENSIFLTCSIGISIYKKDATDEKNLLHHADTAMYGAKDRGKDNYQYYSQC